MDFGLIKELMKLNIAIYHNSNVPGYKIINHYEDDSGLYMNNSNNAINIGSEADIVYTKRIDEIPGSCYLIPYSKSRHPLIQEEKIIRRDQLSKVMNTHRSQHRIENWEDITKMIKYK